MSGKRDFARARAQDRMRRQGVENIGDDGLPVSIGGLPRPRQSKAAARTDLAAAMEKITRTIRCGGCGHSAKVAIPTAKAHARLRCSRCGAIAQ